MVVTVRLKLTLALLCMVLQNGIVDASSCIIPKVVGEMYQQQEKYTSRKRSWGFSPGDWDSFNLKYTKVDAGTYVSNYTFMKLVCPDGYIVKDKNEVSTTVQCAHGLWKPTPLCVAENLLEDLASSSMEKDATRKSSKITLNSCTVPRINNGEIGSYRTTHDFTYHRYEAFVNFREGDPVGHGETIYLICDQTFSPYRGIITRKMPSTCHNGTWSRSFQCLPTSCSGDPPHVENARPELKNRDHGHVLEYECESGYQEVKRSDIVCEFGNWKGEAPKCEQIKKDPCLEDPPPQMYAEPVIMGRNHGEYIFYKCSYGRLPRETGWFICDNGKWMGRFPRCILWELSPFREQKDSFFEHPHGKKFLDLDPMSDIKVARYPPAVELSDESPYFRQKDMDESEENPQFTDENLHLTDQEHRQFEDEYPWSESIYPNGYIESQLIQEHPRFTGEYALRKDEHLCEDKHRQSTDENPQTRTSDKSVQNGNCTDPPPKVENSEVQIKNRTHGSSIWYKCKKGFKRVKSGDVTCVHGVWEGSTPVCVNSSETSCLADPPEVLHADPVIENRTNGSNVWYKCHKGYSKTRAGHIKCETGYWKGELPECRETLQFGNRRFQRQMRHQAGVLPQKRRDHTSGIQQFKQQIGSEADTVLPQMKMDSFPGIPQIRLQTRLKEKREILPPTRSDFISDGY